jgi:hypothetical protein
MHQASVKEAPGHPLTISLMGELVKNKEVGREVAAEGFKGHALDPSAEGVMLSNGFPGICCR